VLIGAQTIEAQKNASIAVAKKIIETLRRPMESIRANINAANALNTRCHINDFTKRHNTSMNKARAEKRGNKSKS